MHIRRSWLAIYMFIGLAACDPYWDIGRGFEIIDGGGSKLSLSKDRIILINYTVTGHGQLGKHIVIESRPYGSRLCEYYIIASDSDSLTLLESHHRTPTGVSRQQAIDAVEALNRRSCKALESR